MEDWWHWPAGALRRCTAHLLPIHTIVARVSGRSLQDGGTSDARLYGMGWKSQVLALPHFPQHTGQSHPSIHHDHLLFSSPHPSLLCLSLMSPHRCQLPMVLATIRVPGTTG